jgi:hypothetical protein
MTTIITDQIKSVAIVKWGCMGTVPNRNSVNIVSNPTNPVFPLNNSINVAFGFRHLFNISNAPCNWLSVFPEAREQLSVALPT